MVNYKKILFIYISLSLIILSSIIYIHRLDHEKQLNNEGLLSSRVYTNLLEEQSRLIFNFEPLETGIKDYISKKDGKIGVYLLNLRDGATLEVNDEILFEPASLNKLPIAILTFRDIEKGKISLDSEILIEEDFIDSSSGTLFQKLGQKITIKKAVDEMLINSDNTAAKALLERIDKEEWFAFSKYLDYYEEEANIYKTSPEANVNLFTSLYLSTILKKENSEYILQKLTESSFPIHQLSNIPSDVKIAQKFGTYYNEGERYYHNCGIMYVSEESRFAYCIMTEGIKSGDAELAIGKIAESIYEYITVSKESIEKSKNL
jgi:beta-lactamase class A